MTILRLSSAATQVVHRGQGGRARVSAAALQLVSSTTPRAARVSAATAQVVTSFTARHARVAFASAQVIVSTGSDGAMARVTAGSMQVVWVTGASIEGRQRAWTFDFDGHSFYVLDLGSAGALVYDLLTGQWTKFETAGFSGNWNFKNGFHWRDGGAVVGGYDATGTLLKLVPQSFLDEGWRPVVYEVRGQLQTGGIDFLRQYSLRMIGSAGVLADSVSPVMRMRFSDDRGETWSAEYTLTLTPNTKQRIEFRSLGAFTHPGRIFRIYDEGGIRFLAVVEADIGGESARLPT